MSPLKVDLFAQPRGKAVYHAGSVIPRAVESSIDERLNPASQWVEQGRRRQSGACYRQRVARPTSDPRARMEPAYTATRTAAMTA